MVEKFLTRLKQRKKDQASEEDEKQSGADGKFQCG